MGTFCRISIIIFFFLYVIDIHAIENKISTATEYFPQPYDILLYDADIKFSDLESVEITAVNHIHLTWTENPRNKAVFIHLRDLTIDSVKYNDEGSVYFVNGRPEDDDFFYYVQAPYEAKTGDTAILSVYYHGKMTDEADFHWGGVRYQEGILYALGVGFSNGYVSTTRHWLPCYDVPSDKARFHAKFNVPVGNKVASNGVVNVINFDNGTDTYEWTHDYPTATYLLTFAAGPYALIEDDYNGLPIELYSLPDDTTASKFVYSHVKDMAAAYEERFGPYPFEKIGYCNTARGAMEHQTMISFSSNYLRYLYSSNDDMNMTVAHELSHQWFGDMVSPYDFRDTWLNEGFAVFSEAIWAEAQWGYTGYLNYVEKTMNEYLYTNAVDEHVFPLYDFPREEPSSNYPYTIYHKGASVLAMLRYELGDSLFFGAVRKYLNDFAYGNVTTKGLQTTMENFSDKDLSTFFDQWVYGRGWPVLTFELIKESESKVRIKAKQVQPKSYGAYLGIPLEFGFKNNMGRTEYRIVRMNEVQQEFTFDSLAKFINVTINQGPTLRTLMKTESISGIQDLKKNNIFLYPNPAADVINIGGENLSGARLTIFDIQGYMLMETIMENSRLDVSGLSPGLYNIVIDNYKCARRMPLVIIR